MKLPMKKEGFDHINGKPRKFRFLLDVDDVIQRSEKPLALAMGSIKKS